ncbi:MAG: ATP-binding protein, partial [Aureibaculum sp.]
QIEAALEKVRSRTMAMHKSKEMLEVIGVVSEQLQQLNLNFDTVSFAKNNQEGDFTFWITSKGQPKPILMEVPTLDSPILKGVYKAQKKGIAFLADVFSSKENREWHEHLIKYSDLKHFPDKIKDFILNAPGFARSSFLLKNIDLYVGNYRAIPFTDEENSIFRRFAHVFEQSYTRFLDLQKAENQAREAQIEGALERVRSKTMAMHNSEDLEDIVVSLFDEVMNLGLDKSIRCGIGILEGHEGMQTRSVNSNSDGTVDLKVGMLNMTIHPMLIGLKKAWKNGRKGYSYEYTAKDVTKYYEALNKEPEYPFNADLKTLPKQEFHRSFFFSSGIIFAFSENPISEESSKILARFAAVFGQTYRRFLDLQKAEAQAREATKQASLDRVRGQIASMRSTADLDRITPLVWNELTTMGVPFIRCGVFIMDEPTQIVEVYLSAPNGHSLGVLHLKFNADPLTKNTVDHWRKGRIFKKHWNREDFLSWTQSLIEQGQISDKNTYQGAVDPPESLDLHFMPFTQGMLYVGSEHPLVEEHIELAQSLADAFAIAYARYEDFTKLEKAKQSVEATLSELKATQNQLVQSEKMASLGELTAGIAHEIQNPLNFVNNFSEVSGELIEEMNDEIEKGDMEEAKAIANDVKQNLEKILHHGKRADAIVKGMLQHSRSSTGLKEPTDINVLADEYLRLAYHGLRAKDKSFNATMKTDYDDSLEKVNVIPQDIGRVILNLITNAFYVVDEKKKQLKDGYEPTVSVSTKKGAGKIEISVKDNGNGIPDKVKEKIFQPFFTTKPTGKGTGLGLSMSYDIVNKGHGGELKVETTEGEGTTFTIALPMV